MTDRAIKMPEDLRARVVSVERMTTLHEQRLSSIEAWKMESDIRTARFDERWGGLEKRLTEIEKDVNGINESLTWLVRLVIGGMIMAIVAYAIRGGFAG